MVMSALANLLGYQEVEEARVERVLGEAEGDGVLSTQDDADIVMSPRFCVLIAQIVMKMQADVPVVLYGKQGSGKSALVKYLEYLHLKCGRKCTVISHDPVLQQETELARILRSGPSSDHDIVFVVVQLSRAGDVNNILKMVTSKTVCGQLAPSCVKFVVEFSDGSIRGSFDPSLVINVERDQEIVMNLLQNLGIPAEVHQLTESLLCNEDISYRNVINFAKVYSWIDQVFFPEHHHVLLSMSCPSVLLKPACALLLAVETVFGQVSDELVQDIAKHYDISSDIVVLRSFKLENVAKVLFKSSGRYFVKDLQSLTLLI